MRFEILHPFCLVPRECISSQPDLRMASGYTPVSQLESCQSRLSATLRCPRKCPRKECISFCLQLDASCLQLRFSAYSCACEFLFAYSCAGELLCLQLELSCLQLEFFTSNCSFLPYSGKAPLTSPLTDCKHKT